MGIPVAVLGIFLVIWIVSNVMRAMQEANPSAQRRNAQTDAANRQRRPGQDAEPRPLNQNSNADIDRFLAELNRLRGGPAAAPPPGGARPVPTVTPVRISTAELSRPANPVERPPATPRRPIGPTAAPRRTAIDRPAVRRAPPAPPGPPALVPSPAPPAPLPPQVRPLPAPEPLTGPLSPARVPSPVLAELQRLLRDRKAGVGAAILLSEIIGKRKGERPRS